MTSKKDREAEEFLAGAGKKKSKAPKQSAPKTVKPKGFVLSMDVMQTLGELGVSLPTNEENVKNTVEELKGKLSYFKENQERVTKEVRTPPSGNIPLHFPRYYILCPYSRIAFSSPCSRFHLFWYFLEHHLYYPRTSQKQRKTTKITNEKP